MDICWESNVSSTLGGVILVVWFVDSLGSVKMDHPKHSLLDEDQREEDPDTIRFHGAG